VHPKVRKATALFKVKDDISQIVKSEISDSITAQASLNIRSSISLGVWFPVLNQVKGLIVLEIKRNG
jgi:hypothetical protein